MSHRGHSLLLLLLLLFALFTVLSFGGYHRTKPEPDRVQLPEDNALLRYFAAANPGKEILKYGTEDFNNDGRKDLIVIYRVGPDKNMMRVIFDSGGGELAATNVVPAPHSNQVIAFRDIDNKPPMEIVVQGTKGAKFGYAVFRVEGGQLIDLFGEGMEDCC